MQLKYTARRRVQSRLVSFWIPIVYSLRYSFYTMFQPEAKRTLRPTASLPTTAETYGDKHGLEPDLQAALQNVGRKGRMSA